MINRTLSNIVLGLIVVIWVVPFIALVATSLRSEMATKTSGFWTSFTPTILGHRFSTHDKNEVLKSNQLTGNIFKRINVKKAYSFIDIKEPHMPEVREIFENEVYKGRRIRVDASGGRKKSRSRRSYSYSRSKKRFHRKSSKNK